MQSVCEVAGVEVRVWLSASLAVVEIRGEVTARSMRDVKDHVIGALSASGPVSGFLVRFDQARVNCTAADLDALFDSSSAEDQEVVPAAMIVREDQLPIFELHSWQVSWRGIVRRAFLSAQPALQWVTEKAAVAAQARRIPPQVQ